MPIKFICRNEDFLYLEDYLSDNFEDIEVVYYDSSNPFIRCEKNVYYVCLVSIPYIIKSEQYKQYKSALNDNSNEIQMLSYAAKVNPIFTKHSNVALLNTEHLSNDDYLKYMKKYLSPKIDVYDFSQKNVELLGRGIYIPYKNNPISTNILKSYIKQKKVKDVCIIGSVSTRRERIVNLLNDNNITIEFINNEFRVLRDRRVGACKILLNVHMYDNTKNYEAVRCERWRFAGMPIISESCIDEVPDGIITCEYDKIIDKVKEVLREIHN